MRIIIYLLLFIFIIITGCDGKIEGDISLEDYFNKSPSVASTYPADLEKYVFPNTDIRVTFNKDMDHRTITANTFIIKDDKGNIEGTVTYSDKKAYFKPEIGLEENTTYTATISKDVTDLIGNNITAEYSWSFTTTTTTLMGGSMQGTSLNLTSANAAVTTFAGSAWSSSSTDATGTSARFNSPSGITTDGTNLFVADASNHTIRKIVISTGVVTTIAGTAGSYGSTDGTGTSARFNFPTGITTDGTNLFVADAWNHTIRKIVISTGVVTTIAGTVGSSGSTDGTGTSARFNGPTGITTDGTSLFVVDSINQTIRTIVISTGVVTTIAGGGTGSIDGTGTSARFYYPSGITTDGTSLFVADLYNHIIRTIVISTGVVTTIAGTAGSSGSTDGTGISARFNKPYGITTDGINLFVADLYNHIIRKIVISTGVVTTIAGTVGSSGSTDGTSTSARFNGPTGITTDGTNLFVGDYYNHTIRKIAPASPPTDIILSEN